LIALFSIKPIAIHDWELIGWQLEKVKQSKAKPLMTAPLGTVKLHKCPVTL